MNVIILGISDGYQRENVKLRGTDYHFCCYWSCLLSFPFSFSFPPPRRKIASGLECRFLPKPVVNRWPRVLGPYLGQIEDKKEVDGKPLFSREKENVGAPKGTCTKLFVAALFIKSNWKESKCLIAVEWINHGEFMQWNTAEWFFKKEKSKILYHVPLIYESYKRNGGQKKPDIKAYATDTIYMKFKTRQSGHFCMKGWCWLGMGIREPSGCWKDSSHWSGCQFTAMDS